MDPLRRHDLEVARTTSPEDKAAQALDAMRFGIQLKWTGLRTRHPELPEAEIDRMLIAWLAGGDGDG